MCRNASGLKNFVLCKLVEKHFYITRNTLTEKCDMAHQHLRQFESVYYALQKFYQDTTVTVTTVKVGFTNGYKEIR
jgi:hypothetical protein